MRSRRQREMHRAIQRRSRERRRNGRRVALIEYDATTVDVLVRRRLIADGVTDARAIGEALTRLIKLLG
jgi:hypothetical protein